MWNYKLIFAKAPQLPGVPRVGEANDTCIIVHFVCGFIVLNVYIAVLSDSENGKFSCIVDAEITNVDKKQVDQSCFTKYNLA